MDVESSRLVKLSTRTVARKERLSYGSWLVGSALQPSAISTDAPLDYELELTALALPSVAIVGQHGSRQRAIRAKAEIRRTERHAFNLVLVLAGDWQVTHMGRTRYRPGDLIFYDSRYPLDCELLVGWGAVNLQLSEQFVRQWLPHPAWLGGRHIVRGSQWGRVLASYVAQLSPEFTAQAPLPQSILVDQLGALLALTAGELSGGHDHASSAERAACDRVHDVIKQRCPEASLQAVDVASSLGISTRTLHRALAAGRKTFGSLLIEARVELAARMLNSPLFDRLTTAEVGRRAGFSDASHFTRVLRERTGRTPLQLRRAKSR